MANELYPTGAGTIILGKAEGTYGTAESLGASQVLYMDECEIEIDEEELPREGLSPQGPGFISAMGRSVCNVSLSTEIALPTLTGTPATTDVSIQPILHACQFAGSVDNTDKSVTFVLGDIGSQGSTFAHRIYNDVDDEGQVRTSAGTVLSPSLSWEAGQRCVISAQGMGLGFDATGAVADVLAAAGAGRLTPTYPATEGAVFMNATVKIYDGTNLYGGGSLASPGNGLALLAFGFDANLDVQAHLGAQPFGGVKRIRGYRSAASTMSLSLEVTDLAEFNPYSLKNTKTVLQVNITLNEGGNHLQFLSQGIITGITLGDGDGRRTYDLELRCVYAPDYSDGSPAAGLSPSQVFVAGTNEGLALDPASALTTPGIAVLQFYTD